MSLESIVKGHPAWFLATFVAVVVGVTLSVEARYAKAGDVMAVEGRLKQELAVQRGYTEAGFLKQRKAQLEDKVFELEAKREVRKISTVEREQLLRYKAQLDDVNRELRTKPR